MNTVSREHWWNNTDSRKLKYLEENLSATNPRWTALRLNLDFHGASLVTACLSHGTAPYRVIRIVIS
jgi:hypothetical protein